MVVSASAGAWANGTLTIDPARPLVLTFPFPANFASSNSAVNVLLGAADLRFSASSTVNTTQTSLALTVPAGTYRTTQSQVGLVQIIRSVPGNPLNAPGSPAIFGGVVTYTTFPVVPAVPVFLQQPVSHAATRNAATPRLANLSTLTRIDAGIRSRWASCWPAKPRARC